MAIKRLYDTLVGATVNVNQLFGAVSSDFWITAEYANGTASFADGECTYTVAAVGISYRYGIRNKPGTFGTVGHKYIVSVDAKASRDGITIGGDICNVGFTFNGSLTTSYQNFSKMLSATGTQQAFICTRSNTQVGDTITFKNMMLIDLTAKFGSTIADYLYNLEQTTAEAGIAKLKEWGFLTEDYYEYNPGSLESVQATAHKITGFNQWDEEWEVGGIDPNTGQNITQSTGMRSKNYIPVFPNTLYYCYVGSAIGSTTSTYFKTRWYDADKNYIGATRAMQYNGTVITPSNARYLRFCPQDTYGTTYNHDICINISSDRNGEYEPYVSHTYDLGTDTLRGLFKLDAENRLYADGDRKTSDGVITRKYGIVDLGTLNWTYNSSAGNERMVANTVPGIMPYSLDGQNSPLPNIICSAFKTIGFYYLLRHLDEGICVRGQGIQIYFADMGTDAAAFKQMLIDNNVKLVYELATPTTEQSTPFTNPQVCYPDGTEEYLTSNGIPVGHETRYQK